MNQAADILTYADQHGIRLSVNGDKMKVKGKLTPDFLEAAKQHKPYLMLMVKVRQACKGVPGITPDQFLALCSPDDLADIKAGHIPDWELVAFAESFATGIQSGRIVFHPTSGQLVRHGVCGRDQRPRAD